MDSPTPCRRAVVARLPFSEMTGVAREQTAEIGRLSIKAVQLANEPAAAFTYFTATLDGGRKALADRIGGCCGGAWWKKPAGLSWAHEFRNARHLRSKYDTAQRHGFHDDDRQALRKAG